MRGIGDRKISAKLFHGEADQARRSNGITVARYGNVSRETFRHCSGLVALTREIMAETAHASRLISRASLEAIRCGDE
jgi:hypothetical protein